MRHFETGATRDEDKNKNDYEGFISPIVTKRFGDYMTSHRKQSDGKLRDSDNWQKGLPLDTYMKSLTRHVEDLKLHHRNFEDLASDTDIESVCCAVMFNVQGYLFEILQAKRKTRILSKAKVQPSLPPSMKQQEQAAKVQS